MTWKKNLWGFLALVLTRYRIIIKGLFCFATYKTREGSIMKPHVSITGANANLCLAHLLSSLRLSSLIWGPKSQGSSWCFLDEGRKMDRPGYPGAKSSPAGRVLIAPGQSPCIFHPVLDHCPAGWGAADLRGPPALLGWFAGRFPFFWAFSSLHRFYWRFFWVEEVKWRQPSL